jgi:membrane protease YdiL (CAAX protease family)
VAGFGLDSVSKFVALGVFYSLAHSLLEEYYWRWFVFGQLRSLVRLWPAIIVASLGFMAHHVLVLSLYFGWWTWPTLLFSACVAVGGAFWAWLYDRTGSLLGPWLSHLLVDAGIFFIGFELVRSSLR